MEADQRRRVIGEVVAVNVDGRHAKWACVRYSGVEIFPVSVPAIELEAAGIKPVYKGARFTAEVTLGASQEIDVAPSNFVPLQAPSS